MAKEIGNTKGSIKDIKSIQCYYNFSVRGNSHEFPCDEVDGQMIDDYITYLNDKDFLEKYSDKIPSSFEDDDFNENGMADEFRVTQEYYVTFKDDSEIYIDFSLPDYDFITADIRDWEEAKGKLAEKWLPEYSSSKWNMSIDELEKQVARNKMEKGGKLPEKGTPEWHQLQIAKKTINMTPIMAELMGGMTIEEAKAILDKYKIKMSYGGITKSDDMESYYVNHGALIYGGYFGNQKACGGYMEKGGKMTEVSSIKHSKDGYINRITGVDGELIKEITMGGILYRRNPVYKTYNSVTNNELLHKTDIEKMGLGGFLLGTAIGSGAGYYARDQMQKKKDKEAMRKDYIKSHETPKGLKIEKKVWGNKSEHKRPDNIRG